MLTAREQEKAAKEFAQRWAGRGDEKQDTQSFWLDLLQTVYGVAHPTSYIEFEKPVALKHTSFIDSMIPSKQVLIEQKSIGIDLRKAYKQSDGQILTPYEQAIRYNGKVAFNERAKWIITCNFSEFLVWDMNNPSAPAESILLKNLGKEYHRLQFLINVEHNRIQKEVEISKSAGELVGRIYEKLYEKYKLDTQKTDEEIHEHINKLCVRLVFCLYAEDAGLFGSKNMFSEYLGGMKPEKVRKALLELFRILDTPLDKRSPYEENILLEFPYVNGSLFSEAIEIPPFDQDLLQTILNDGASFDWSEISPTIFGGIFESTLNPETRHAGGMHYTSIENIHKVIDPLFLNNLNSQFKNIMSLNSLSKKERIKRLKALQNHMASLSFLDPAAGSGNFLTESYLSLRRLENDILRETVLDSAGSALLGFNEAEFHPIKISIDQFYGIEINDFAVAVARTAMWIAEAQMLKETEHIVKREIAFFPLHSFVNIHEANALQLDWENIISSKKLNFIIGNPPFLGYKQQSKEQKEDLRPFLGNIKNVDYVAGWYYKTCEFIKATNIRVAFVSTNSICQGEQATAVWKRLFDDYNLNICFAYQSFVWNSESDNEAKVHCVIIGFSCYCDNTNNRVLYFEDGSYKSVKFINQYLLDGPKIFINKVNKPISPREKMVYGSEPRDGGNLILSKAEAEKLVLKTPKLSKYIHKFIGSEEFINGTHRYCLWFADEYNARVVADNEEVLSRIEKCRAFRLNSKQKQAYASASTPHLFTSIRQPKNNYLLIPIVSSEKRKYIPIGYMFKDIIVNNACFTIDGASLLTFGILSSNIHMAWMRLVAGRLEMRYRYSKDIVYNTFPMPKITKQVELRIKETAKGILAVRDKYKDLTLADLYGKKWSAYIDLVEAHRVNDVAVMEAYGFSPDMDDDECIIELIKLYSKIIDKN